MLSLAQRFFSNPFLLAIIPFAVLSNATFANKGIVLILLVGAFIAAFRSTVHTWPWPRDLIRIAIVSSVLVAWAFASAIWSIDPHRSLVEAGKLLVLSACGIVLVLAGCRRTDRERDILGFGLVIGALVLLSELAFEVATGGLLTSLLRPEVDQRWAWRALYLQNGAVVLSVLLWPTLWLVGKRWSRWLAAALLAVCLLVEAMIHANAAILAALAGMTVFGAALRAPRVTASALAVLMVFIFALAPASQKVYPADSWLRSLPSTVEFSTIHRLRIWSFAADRIVERPIFGWGLDASRSIPGGRDILGDVAPQGYGPGAEKLPLHPHNMVIQFWLELGGVGAAIALALVLMILRSIDAGRMDRPPSQTAMLLATMTSALIVAGLSYGIWQSWWQSTLWLAGVIACSLVSISSRGGSPDRSAGR